MVLNSTLAEIGLLLYGPNNQSHLAHALSISLSTLQRMMRQGNNPLSSLPEDYRRKLWDLLCAKRDKIDLMIWMLTVDEVSRELEEDKLDYKQEVIR